jgi:divalent metal cation (Fe/Co/Zn/Cd) transporter
VLHLREKRASVGIGLVFIALAITVVATAAKHLAEATEPSEPLMLMGLSLPSVIVFGVLGVAKLWLGSTEQLDSPSMRKVHSNRVEKEFMHNLKFELYAYKMV